jgi:Ca-activated chloride channel homolog
VERNKLKKTIFIFLFVVLGLNQIIAAPFTTYWQNQKGITALTHNKYEKALEYFSQAVTKSPENSEIYYNLGNVFYRTSDLDKAINSYQDALVNLKREKKAAAFYNLGNTFYAKKELESAKKMYQHALEIQPDDLDSKINLELILKQEKEKKEHEDKKPDKQNLDQQKKEAKKEAAAKDKEKKENARRALSSLDKKEKAARQKYRPKQQEPDRKVDLDW